MSELILLFELMMELFNSSESSTVKRKRKEDEKKIAQSFTSSFPYFVKILKNGNVGGSRTLVSCSLFILKYRV